MPYKQMNARCIVRLVADERPLIGHHGVVSGAPP
jgi:hypothetical protein